MSDEKLSKKDAITWGIIIGGWIFSLGGTYFMIKDHERRITGLESKDEKRVSKEDFENRLKDLRWTNRTR